MKKIGTAVAIFSATALGLTMFAACGKNDDSNRSASPSYAAFDVTDYAHPLDSAYAKANLVRVSTQKAPTAMVKKNYTDISKIGDFAKATVTDAENKNTYVLYDAVNDKELFTGLSSVSTVSSYANNTIYIYVLGETKDEVTTYKIASPDGKVIVSGLETSEVDFSRESSYSENGINYYVMSLSYTKDEKTVTKNFAYNKTEDKIIWKEITEIPSDGYEIGEVLSPKRPLINTALYPDCTDALKDYEVVSDGTTGYQTLTFYKDDNVTGSLTIDGGSVLGYVGDYIFYVRGTYVPSDSTSGYNMEYPQYQAKGNIELYRYNVVEGGEAEKLNVNYAPSGSGSSLYNYSTNKFDRLLINAQVTSVNGIYISGNPSKTVVIDESGTIQAQVNGRGMDYNRVIKLTDTTFLSYNSGYSGTNYIVDKNLATVATLSGVSLWEEQSLLVCEDVAVDFNGKAAVNLPYSGNVTKFDSAFVSVEGSSYNGIATVYSKKYPNGKLVTDIVAGEEHQVMYAYGMILKAVTSEDVPQTITMTAYTLEGNKIGSDMTVSTSSSEPLSFGSVVAIKGVENEKPVVYILK